jgi:hypothetical protein
MLKKAILSSFLFLFIYALFIQTKSSGTSQHQWQDNVVKAQRFLYAENLSQNVIVGSSLACRLVTDKLPNTFNLSFPAMTIYDGLNIIFLKKKLPKHVFIETNLVLSQESKDFFSSLDNSILYNARKAFPILRDEYQPVGMLGSAIILSMNKLKTKVDSFLPQKKIITYHNNVDENIFQKLLNLQKESYSQRPEEKQIKESFQNLTGYVNSLERKGVNIIFFEMPVNGTLCSLPKAITIRESFFKYFPPTKYQYIPMPPCTEYKTTDGVHLGYDEALKYTSYFKIAAQSFLSDYR